MNPLIGRERELALLDAAHAEALAGRGALVVLRGAAGIGKTALVEAAVRRWPTRTLRAACWEVGGAPPFWPWRQVLRDLGASLDAARARFATVEAIARTVAEAAGDGLVVVVDDLHAADPPSLDALRLVAHDATTRRLLVLVTRRDVGIPAEVGAALAPFDRVGRSIALQGLDAPSVAALVADRRGAPPTPDEVRRLLDDTGGNPFLVGEVAAAGPGAHGVRQLVLAHLAHLPPAAMRALAVAAVVGRTVDVAFLEAVAGVDTRGHVALAVAERVLVRDVDGVRLAHALLRETLYDALPTAERRAWHAAVARRLRDDPGAPASERARHWRLAGPEHAAEARRSLLAAARDAAVQHAWEEAAGAWDALLAIGPVDGDERLEAARVLGLAGRREAADALCEAVLADARHAGDAARFARAAVLLGATREFMQRDSAYVALLEEALALDLPAPVRVEVAGRLARQPAIGADVVASRRRIAAEAVAAAGDDPALLLGALDAALFASYGPASTEERLGTSERLAALARAAGDRTALLSAMRWRIGARWELGQVHETAGEVEEYAALADAVHDPSAMINARMRRTVLAWLGGRWAEGDAHALAALEVGRRAGDPQAELAWHAPRLVPALWKGDGATIDESLPTVLEGHRRLFAPFLCGLAALALASTGRAREAAAVAGDLARHPERVPEDFSRLFALACLADLAVLLGDGEAAAPLGAALAPFAGRNVVLGAVGCLGSVALRLGRLAVLAGDSDRARAHLEEAVREHRRWGLSPLVPIAERALADVGGTSVPARTAWLAPADAGWRIGFDPGRPTASRRGFAHLARLVTAPGEEIAATELAGAGLEDEGAPPIDEDAIAAYRRRRRVLQARLADADEGAPGAHRLRAEIEALEDEVRRAVGLGGRRRRPGATSERARTSVAVAIRRAIDAVAEVDPALGEHLRRSVRTGHRCVYLPDPLVPVAWRVTT